jgi:uncharacterized protein YdeI (YjbR/CyaY-like superfamily)
MKQVDTLPIISFAYPKGWESWLHKRYSDSKGIWLKIARKESGIRSISYSEALEIALCYGWIDGQKRSLDDNYWLQKFTPRGPKSVWSKVNREKAEALIVQEKIKPAGLEQVRLAKEDGRWDRAYDSQSKITIPPDFQQELDKNPKAKEFFSTINSINRYAILMRIQTAKKPETRSSRIHRFVDMLAKHKTLYP